MTDSGIAHLSCTLCNEGPRLPILSQEYWHYLLLLLSGRWLFLKEFCNLSTLGAPLHTQFHLQSARDAECAIIRNSAVKNSNNLCRKLETKWPNQVQGCRIIRRAEFLKDVRYFLDFIKWSLVLVYLAVYLAIVQELGMCVCMREREREEGGGGGQSMAVGIQSNINILSLLYDKTNGATQLELFEIYQCVSWITCSL